MFEAHLAAALDPYLTWDFGRLSGTVNRVVYLGIAGNVGGPVSSDGGRHICWLLGGLLSGDTRT